MEYYEGLMQVYDVITYVGIAGVVCGGIWLAKNARKISEQSEEERFNQNLETLCSTPTEQFDERQKEMVKQLYSSLYETNS